MVGMDVRPLGRSAITVRAIRMETWTAFEQRDLVVRIAWR
jgi:hypothetical protein